MGTFQVPSLKPFMEPLFNNLYAVVLEMNKRSHSCSIDNNSFWSIGVNIE